MNRKNISFLDMRVGQIAMHGVGNKLLDEGVRVSDTTLTLDDLELLNSFLNITLKPFSGSVDYYNLYHESGNPKLNIVYNTVSRIFKKPDDLLEQSHVLLRHLYEHTTHPTIPSGELYVVYFNDCWIDGECVDAIGIFKAERKETYLKFNPAENSYNIETDKGLNAQQLTKACVIFNTQANDGYVVMTPSLKKTIDLKYWIDDFLHATILVDNHIHTINAVKTVERFIKEQLPVEFDITTIDQVDFTNRAHRYFKENESFDLTDFANEVFEQPDIARLFEKYNTDALEVNISEFTIEPMAVKKSVKRDKCVLKLDKNFHVYIHGSREMVEQGVDENGRKYYKLFYENEQ